MIFFSSLITDCQFKQSRSNGLEKTSESHENFPSVGGDVPRVV